jgi:hypothetical protein
MKVFLWLRRFVAVFLTLAFLAIVIPEFLPEPARVDSMGEVIPAFPLQWKALLIVLTATLAPLTMIFVGGRGKVWMEACGWGMLLTVIGMVISL